MKRKAACKGGFFYEYIAYGGVFTNHLPAGGAVITPTAG